ASACWPSSPPAAPAVPGPRPRPGPSPGPGLCPDPYYLTYTPRPPYPCPSCITPVMHLGMQRGRAAGSGGSDEVQDVEPDGDAAGGDRRGAADPGGREGRRT